MKLRSGSDFGSKMAKKKLQKKLETQEVKRTELCFQEALENNTGARAPRWGRKRSGCESLSMIEQLLNARIKRPNCHVQQQFRVTEIREGPKKKP